MEVLPAPARWLLGGRVRPGGSVLQCRGQNRWADAITFSASLDCMLSPERCCLVTTTTATSECGPGFTARQGRVGSQAGLVLCCAVWWAWRSQGRAHVLGAVWWTGVGGKQSRYAPYQGCKGIVRMNYRITPNTVNAISSCVFFFLFQMSPEFWFVPQQIPTVGRVGWSLKGQNIKWLSLFRYWDDSICI